MPDITGEILPTPEANDPFKVVFTCEGRKLAEQQVNSRLSGEELIASLLPVLQGFDPD